MQFKQKLSNSLFVIKFHYHFNECSATQLCILWEWPLVMLSTLQKIDMPVTRSQCPVNICHARMKQYKIWNTSKSEFKTFLKTRERERARKEKGAKQVLCASTVTMYNICMWNTILNTTFQLVLKSQVCLLSLLHHQNALFFFLAGEGREGGQVEGGGGGAAEKLNLQGGRWFSL